MNQMPVTNQPMSLMANQVGLQDIPINTMSGFDILQVASELFVHRQSGRIKIYGVDFKQRYVVTNQLGQQVLNVHEPYNKWNCCWFWKTEFDLLVRDQLMNEVFTIHRPGKNCCRCWTPVDEMTVYSFNQMVGQVEEKCTCCIPMFEVKGLSSGQRLSVRGPCCSACCESDCTEDLFEVTGFNGVSVGRILKMQKDCCDDCCSMDISKSFAVQFDQSDVETKMLLLTACFLINQNAYINEHVFVYSGGQVFNPY